MTKPVRLIVNAPDSQYPILIGDDLLATLPDLLAERHLTGRVAVVTNDTLAPLYGETLIKTLNSAGGINGNKNNAVLIKVPDGEQYKTLDTTRQLYDAFLDAGLDRNAVIVALGGGVIGDMVGFAAATYLRGVPFVQVPTSLLAMVDASVGGKVAVDLPQGKNLIGAFKQPALVVVDTAVLKTLPDAEWRCGVAEVIKAGLIAEPSLLDPQLYKRGAAKSTLDFITRAISIKVSVVEEDPYEKGARAYLNLGHTFAHAIERVSHYGWRHGEAVGLGLLAAARLSQLQGLCDMNLPFKVEQLLKALGLPTRYSGYTSAEIRAAMNTDKKRQGETVRFVLLTSAGEPILASDVPDAKVLSVLDTLRA